MRKSTMRAWGLAGLVCATLGASACKRESVRAPEEAAVASSEAGPQPELVVQAGSSHWVKDTKFSPDGRWLAVASVDGLIKLYDVRMGKEWRTLSGAAGPVYTTAWSADGKRLAGAGFDKTIHVWDVASGAEVATLPGHSGWVGSIEFSPDGKRLASAAQLQDQVVAIWDLEQRAVKHALMHTKAIKDLAWSRDGKTLLTVTDEINVWNAEAGGLLGTIAVAANGPGGRLLRFSPDGKLVAFDVGDAVHVYDAGSWAEASRVPGTLVGWASDGEMVVHRGRELLRVEPRGGRKIGGFAAAEDSGLVRAELSPGGRIAAAIDDMQVDLYDGATGAKLRTFRSTFWSTVGGAFGNDAELLHVAWSPTAPVIATGGFDGMLRVLDLRRGAAPKAVTAGPKIERDPSEENFLGFQWAQVGLVDDVQFSRDGQHVLTRDFEGVSMWDARTLTLWRRFAVGGATAESMAPDGKSLAIAHGDAIVSVFDVATGKKLRSSKGGGLDADCQKSMGSETISTSASVSGLGWSADAKKLYVVFRETATFVEFDAQTFALGQGGCAHRNRINGVTWSDAGDKVAIGAGTHMLAQTISEVSFGDNSVHVFGLAGEMPLLHRLQGHSLAVLGADFSRDGNVLATASADRTTKLWDMRSGSLMATLAGHAAEVDSVAFSHDDRYVATASYDLTVKVWDLATKAEVATIVTIGADGYVIETPDHYYTASRQGFESVSFRLGETVVPVELFDLRLNRPDLVLKRFGYAPPELLALYEKAYKKRLKKMRIDEAALQPTYHLPTAKIAGEVPVSTPGRTLQLQVTADDARFELDRLLVYVNDVPIHGSGGIDLRGEKARHHERAIAVELLPGRNKIQVSTLNSAGTESRKDTVEVVSTAPAPGSDLYVLAVGVSKYADVKMNLKYAAKDARDIAGMFKARGSRFGKVEVLQILDGEARRENILAARQKLLNTKIDDQVVVFVAGHGMLDTNLDYYFVTHDFEREAPGKRGLSYDQLESLLDGIPARRKLMMMDTCHSGEVDEDAVRTAPPLPGGAARGDAGQVKLATDFRSFSYSGAIQSPDSSHEVLAQLFADLRRGSGAAVISSASGAEFALESPQWQNGVFTFSVLQGLTSGQADLDRDGTVRVSELREYVVGEVRRLTQGAQTPTSRRENLEFDFPVL